MDNLDSIRRIALFGSGVTASAVRSKLVEFPRFTVVEADDSPDVGIISPGLVTDEYRSRYAFPIISETELAHLLFRHVGKTPFYIAISGTNGKTTVTHLVAQLLNIPMAGNVGTPLIHYVSPNPALIPDQMSLELSSYQIEQSPTFTPDIFVLMNITPDHLDRHKTMENYARIKLELASRLSSDQTFIYNGVDDWTTRLMADIPLRAQCIDFRSCHERFKNELAVMPLLGPHNIDNLLAALCAVSVVHPGDYAASVAAIRPVPHRLETVGCVRGATYINDSKGTNPDSTLAALASLPMPTIVLLLGGQRKQVSYDALFEVIRTNQVRVITFGEARSFFNEQLTGYSQLIGSEPTLADATRLASRLAVSGDHVLLSPSCASFDEFHNFEERGHAFRDTVSRLSA